MKLTQNFELSEFEQSSIATAHHIDNHVPAALIPNIKNLCEQVLEPLRQHFNEPIVIGSGYRCPQLNALAGGVKYSQHLTGEAADIRIPVYDFVASDGTHHTNMEILNKWFIWIMDNCDFDQLIKETTNRKTYWIHVSCKRDRSQNRHSVITFLLKGGGK